MGSVRELGAGYRAGEPSALTETALLAALGRIRAWAGLHVPRVPAALVLRRAQDQAVRHPLGRIGDGQDAAGRVVRRGDDGASRRAVPAAAGPARLERLSGAVRLPQPACEPLRFYAVLRDRPPGRPAREPAAGVFRLPGRDEPGPRRTLSGGLSVGARIARAPDSFA